MSVKKIDIIVIGDRNVDIGLHVTLYSLLKNSSYHYHVIHYITKDYQECDRQKLNATLEEFKESYVLDVIECDDKDLKKYKGLHGNTFTYSKLLLSDLVACEVALYIDIDIVVNIDIYDIQEYISNVDRYMIMANPERTLKTSLEKELYIEMLKLNNKKYYNAGVMIINLKKWREKSITSKFLKFAGDYSQFLKSADQTVINGVLNENNIGHLPDKYNIRIENYHSKDAYVDYYGILHFYGRPKPWDLFAEYVHPHYSIFKKVLENTYYKDYNSLASIDKNSLSKMVLTYKSYLKSIFKLKL